MSKFRTSSWISYFDPVYGQVIQTTPDDTPESLAVAVEHLQWLESRRSAGVAGIGTGSPLPTEAPSAEAPQPVAGALAPIPAASAQLDTPEARRRNAWLSEVIDQFHADQVERGAWKVKSTWTNTYAPALRVFRELISTMQRVPEGSETAIWDIRMSDIDIDRIAGFTKMIRKFPANQGKRPGGKDAKAILNAASTAQSPANAAQLWRALHVNTPTQLATQNEPCSAEPWCAERVDGNGVIRVDAEMWGTVEDPARAAEGKCLFASG